MLKRSLFHFQRTFRSEMHLMLAMHWWLATCLFQLQIQWHYKNTLSIYRHLVEHVLKLIVHIPALRLRWSNSVSPILKGWCVMSKLSNTWPHLNKAIVSLDAGSHKLLSQNALSGETGRAAWHSCWCFSYREQRGLFASVLFVPECKPLEFMSANS